MAHSAKLFDFFSTFSFCRLTTIQIKLPHCLAGYSSGMGTRKKYVLIVVKPCISVKVPQLRDGFHEVENLDQ